MRNLLLTLMVLALAACSMGNPVVGAEGDQSEKRNQEKWRDANISHYRYNLNLSCFCVFAQDMPLIIEVMDGKVVSMEYQSGNKIDATNLELFDRYATIDRIFSELEADLAGAADEVTVMYDPTYAFPIQATIDFVKEATDDELYLTISDFEALP
jgi:hypothetical protein